LGIAIPAALEANLLKVDTAMLYSGELNFKVITQGAFNPATATLTGTSRFREAVQ
jgi:hypothetical protein